MGVGTDTSGTKPQTGGKVPVADKPADKTSAPKATGAVLKIRVKTRASIAGCEKKLV